MTLLLTWPFRWLLPVLLGSLSATFSVADSVAEDLDYRVSKQQQVLAGRFVAP